jgi:type IV secretory pathway VirB2 component (pilin)
MTRAQVSRRWLFLGAALVVPTAIIWAGWAGPARAEPQAATFDDANRAFAEGHYAAAVAGFEALARTHGWSAPLLYDLANAYAQAGRVGRAVLSYERARLLAPRDADIVANLAYVRARAGLPRPPAAWYRVAAGWLGPAGWTWLAAIGLWLAGASLLAARRWHARKLLYVGVVALLLGATSVTAVVVSDQALSRAVVVESKSAPVRVSPFAGAASESSLSEGEVVAVLGRHEDFVRVRDGRGRTGWVQSATVQSIVPPTS